jgi:hypothetical protein
MDKNYGTSLRISIGLHWRRTLVQQNIFQQIKNTETFIYYINGLIFGSKPKRMKAKFLLLLLLICFSTFAQKVDLDRFHFNVQYRNFPNILVNKNYNTFNLLFGGSPTSKSFMMEDELYRSISIFGWKQLSYKGHLTIQTFFGDFIIKTSTVNERKEDIKDKDGKITGTKYHYSAQIVYTFPISYTVTDYKGAMLTTESVLGGDRTWVSQEYERYKDAADYYNNNRGVIRSNLSRKDMQEALRAITAKLNFNFGFPPASNYTKLWILNNKKHPEFEAAQKIWNQFKDVTPRVTYEGVSDADKQILLSVIAYFDGLKTKYAGSDKTDKKMRYSSYFNNAMIYTWFLDDFDAAIKEADGLIANDYDSGDGKDLKKDAERFKELLKRNAINSLHYVINVDDAMGPQ